MKILKISLLNLNSLRGEHTIDLLAEPLGSAGIFAITGHTGAGKSTLLDAITLALYGRAARYGESPNPEDMMSRHTGECRAEVEFEVPNQRPFKAVWHLRRAKSQIDGKIQPAKRYIYDADGNVLAEKLREVDQVVEQLCGLNYHRFTRSVLLAQGEFAKFLRAKPDERAELLESLTQTSIYSELGLLVHTELTRRESALRESEAALTHVTLLGEKEREQKTLATNKLDQELVKLKADRSKLANNVSLGKQLLELLKTNSELELQQKELEERQAESKPQLEQLNLHRKATPFLPQLTRWEQASAELTKRTQAKESATKAQQTAQTDLISSLQFAVKLGGDELAVQTKQHKELKELGLAIQKQIDATTEWITKHNTDAKLPAVLPEVSSQLTLLGRNRTQLSQLDSPSQWPDQKSAANRLNELTQTRHSGKVQTLEQLQQRKSQLAGYEVEVKNIVTAKANIETVKKQLEKATEEVEASVVPLKQASEKSKMSEELLKTHREHRRTAERMASLEEHRNHLESGEPCPLCGALEHPFKESDSGLVKVSEIDVKIQTAEADLKKARDSEQEFRDLNSKAKGTVEQITKRLTQLTSDSDKLTNRVEKLSLELRVQLDEAAVKVALKECDLAIEVEKKIQLEIDAAQQAISFYSCSEEIKKSIKQLGKVLQPFEIPVPKPGLEKELYVSVERRSQQYQESENKLRQLKDQQRDSGEQIKEAGLAIKQTQSSLKPIEKQLSGCEPPAAKSTKSISWASLEQAIAGLSEIDQAAKTAVIKETSAGKELTVAEAEAKKLEEALANDLSGTGFKNAPALLAARLPEEKMNQLVDLEKQLIEQQQQLKGRRESTGESIVKLREQNVPEATAYQELAENLSVAESTIESKTDELSTVKVALTNDDKNRKLHESKTSSLKDEREQLRVWNQLHGLIGDSKGKKFRSYAQGISLDLLIRRANAHLQRLTDRYLLQRVESEELELEIEDRFQANVTRPMASLSGGESFLASLALALGLSDLAGRNVQIDSLFIDEGFGSLDSDTLEIAISALESLRLSNKTVGVISHVEILKERIATQISVEKQPDGTSQVVLKQ